MQISGENSSWKICYEENSKCQGIEIRTIEQLRTMKFREIEGHVPGNFELDLMAADKLEDLYYSTNTLKAQRLENMHVWYYTYFQVSDVDSYLNFEGIDTICDIYINGELCKSTDNMFMEYKVYGNFFVGVNELLVHIRPVCIESRKYKLSASCFAQKYSYASLYSRKAAHMFGWDIMPRIVSCGIWKPVTLCPAEKDKITDLYIMTASVDREKNRAELRISINVDVQGDFITDYRVLVKGQCGESIFAAEETLWHTSYQFSLPVENCRLWWPENSGQPCLYSTTVSLYAGDKLCDVRELKVGIRDVALNYKDGTAEKNKFCFQINGKDIFVLGTNWVPLDAFHSKDAERLQRTLELLDDTGCNMVRCWGGNVYGSDEFFDFCDEKGIMVWQDFAMGCGVYPQEQEFYDRIEEEAVFQIKRLRNHPSLVLWAGDNECDLAYQSWSGYRRDPDNNNITRSILRRAVEAHDYARPYLASSPFVSAESFRYALPLPEDHLWGPRDYFKSDFYKNEKSHFASEIGYHGFPCPRSLKKFLRDPEKIFNEDGRPTDEYIVHSSCMEINENAPYYYRIRLAYDQVKTMFNAVAENLSDFTKQSRISQAEAYKYFIERFRIKKWYKTGIIWWNLIDGWPQVSDAVVDYYYEKKLAYFYIKRSQVPVCLMFDEPEDECISLYGVNDLPCNAVVELKVTRLNDKKVVFGKTISINGDSSIKITEISCNTRVLQFYLAEWKFDGKNFKNHYCTKLKDIDFNEYMKYLESADLDEF